MYCEGYGERGHYWKFCRRGVVQVVDFLASLGLPNFHFHYITISVLFLFTLYNTHCTKINIYVNNTRYFQQNTRLFTFVYLFIFWTLNINKSVTTLDYKFLKVKISWKIKLCFLFISLFAACWQISLSPDHNFTYISVCFSTNELEFNRIKVIRLLSACWVISCRVKSGIHSKLKLQVIMDFFGGRRLRLPST